MSTMIMWGWLMLAVSLPVALNPILGDAGSVGREET
jgi:hypothetical protein